MLAYIDPNTGEFLWRWPHELGGGCGIMTAILNLEVGSVRQELEGITVERRSWITAAKSQENGPSMEVGGGHREQPS